MKDIYLVYPKKIGNISPEIYGHFSEHIGGVFYDGLWVGKNSEIPNIRGFRKDLIEKLRVIKPAVLRWPGGCYAETYHWRDGIGKNRPTRINWWTGFDHRMETNDVGTHEFLDLCELIGAKPYFAANLTSMTPMDIRNWMDYCLSPRGSTTLALEREKNGHPDTFDIPFWGVGNENWGGGGNMMPEFYGDECRRYGVIMRNVAPNAELYACGTNGPEFSWTQKLAPKLVNADAKFNGFAMHYYCGTKRCGPLEFDKAAWDESLKSASQMETIINRNWNILSGYGLDNVKLIVDEWGIWHPDGTGPSKGYNLFEQQSTINDAMISALTLNIFNNHCDKVRMANVAQLVNNLHCLFLAGGDQMIVTPTYHVFDMFKEHQGADAIESIVTDNDDITHRVSVSASVKNGKTLVTLGNFSFDESVEIRICPFGAEIGNKATMTLLSADDLRAHNTFDASEAVKPVTMSVDPTKPIVLPKGGIAAVSFE